MTEEVDQWFLLNTGPTADTEGRSPLQSNDGWSLPEFGRVKCNIHANWKKMQLFIVGLAWIARDHSGNVLHHARDAIVHDSNRFIAELKCVIWAMTSLSDIGIRNVTIGSDYNEELEAIKSSLQWPRFRMLLIQITNLKERFESITFEGEKVQANGISRDIARSILRDGQFQSYLALGGPSWFQDRLMRERNRRNV